MSSKTVSRRRLFNATGAAATVYGHLANISYRVGRNIVWDGGRESIADDPDASALPAREYREPWTL